MESLYMTKLKELVMDRTGGERTWLQLSADGMGLSVSHFAKY